MTPPNLAPAAVASPGLASRDLALWDRRRQAADLYAAVRAEPDPQAAWQHRRTVRGVLATLDDGSAGTWHRPMAVLRVQP